MTTFIATQMLRPHPHNEDYWTPLSETSDKYLVLLESIDRNGIEVPLKVQRDSHVVLSGHTRLRIANDLGLLEVPVEFLDVSDAEAEEILVRENFERRPDEKNPMKIARQLGVMRDVLGMSHSSERNVGKHSAGEIAQGFHLRRSQYFDYLRLLELVPELQEKVEDGTLGVSAGSSLAKLDPDMQIAVYHRLSQHKGRWTAEVVKQFCRTASMDEFSPLVQTDDKTPSKPRKKKKQPKQQVGILADLLAPEEAVQYATDVLQAEIVRYQSSVEKMRDELGQLLHDYVIRDATVQESMAAFVELLDEVSEFVRSNAKRSVGSV